MAPSYSYYKRSTSDKGVPVYNFYTGAEEDPNTPSFIAPTGGFADSFVNRLEDRTDPPAEAYADPGMSLPPKYGEYDQRIAQQGATPPGKDPAAAPPAPSMSLPDAPVTPEDPPNQSVQPPAQTPAAPATPAGTGTGVGIPRRGLPRDRGAAPFRAPTTRVGALADEVAQGKHGDLSITTEGSSSSQESGEKRIYTPEAQEIINRLNERMDKQEAAFAEAEQARRYHEDEARKLEYSKRAVDEEFDKKAAELEKKRLEAVQKYHDESEAARKALKDPKDYWKDKGVGSQILMGIAVALGAFGTRPGEENQGVKILNDALDNHMRMRENQYRKALEGRDITNEEYSLMQQRLAVDRIQALKQVHYQVADQIAQSLNPTYRKEFMDDALADIDSLEVAPLTWQQQVQEDMGKGGSYSPYSPNPIFTPNALEIAHGGIPQAAAASTAGGSPQGKAAPRAPASPAEVARGKRDSAALDRAGAPVDAALKRGTVTAPIPGINGKPGNTDTIRAVPPATQQVDMSRQPGDGRAPLRTAPVAPVERGSAAPERPAPVQPPTPAPAPKEGRTRTPGVVETPQGRRAAADLERVGKGASAALDTFGGTAGDTVSTRLDPALQKADALKALKDYNTRMEQYRSGFLKERPAPLSPEQLRVLFQGVQEEVKATPKEEKTSKQKGTPAMTPAQRAALEALQRIQRGADKAAAGGPSVGGVTSTPAERSVLENWKKKGGK